MRGNKNQSHYVNIKISTWLCPPAKSRNYDLETSSTRVKLLKWEE
jgi:hypothetical protein